MLQSSYKILPHCAVSSACPIHLSRLRRQKDRDDRLELRRLRTEMIPDYERKIQQLQMANLQQACEVQKLQVELQATQDRCADAHYHQQLLRNEVNQSKGAPPPRGAAA